MYPFGRVKQISHDITILPEIVNRRVLIKVHTDHSAGEWLLFVVDTLPGCDLFLLPRQWFYLPSAKPDWIQGRRERHILSVS
jgi:hypothetical protein